MTKNIDVFPQHQAGKRKGKPTIVEIVNDGIKTGQTPMAIFHTIGALYPKTTMGEMKAAFEAEIKRVTTRIERNQTDPLVALGPILTPIWNEPGNEDLEFIQVARIAAERGSELAARAVAHLESDEAKAWWRDFKAAVALDPYWEMSADGRSATRKDGARYKTAEDLVAAYRANQLGNDAAD
jgi:hypothetical protein